MAEQGMTVAQQIAKSPVNWSIGLVKNFIERNPGLMQTEQAQRAAMSAASKVMAYMTEQGLKWDQVDINHLGRIFIRLAITGLDAESNDWYAYSRRNSKTGLQQFDPNPSYQGERKLRIKYSIGSFGKIRDISAVTIREGDVVKIKRDLFGKVSEVVYDPIPFNKGAVVGYLGITLFEDGTTTVQEFTPDKILEYKKANPNGGSPAWEKWPEEMAHAKVIKHTARAYQYELPSASKKALTTLDVEDIEEEADRNENTIDITPAEPEPLPEQVQEEKVAEPEPKPATKKQKQEPEQVAISDEELPEALR